MKILKLLKFQLDISKNDLRMVQKDFFAKVTIYRILSDLTWCHPFQIVKYYQHYLWTSSPITILIMIMITPSR